MSDRLTRFLTPPHPAQGSQRISLSIRALLLLALIALASFAPGIASLPPTDRDESWFAQAAKQMIETGNYVDIRVQEKPRYKKPAGAYWLQAAAVKLFSPDKLNEIWAYRLPSLACAVVSVLLTALLGACLFSSPLTGFASAIMMASCLALNVEARLAKTDAALLACVLAAQLALARTWMKSRTSASPRAPRTNGRDAALFWTALGVGILVKGPIVALVVGLTVLGLYVSEPKKRKNLLWLKSLRPLPGLLWTSLIVAPWLIAISLQSGGAFLEQAAGHDFFAKLWQGQDRGFMPPGLHLAVFPLMFFPFSLFAALAAPYAWRNRRDPGIRYCLCWILPVWVVFELSLTKLPHYALPVYPAIAMLAAAAIFGKNAETAPPPSKAQTVLFALATGIWLTLGAGLALLAGWLPFALNGAPDFLQALAGASLILAQGACLYCVLNRNALAGMAVLALGQTLFLSVAASSTAPSLRHVWLSRDVVEAADRVKPCRELSLISASYNEPSLVFLAGTHTKIFPDGRQAAHALKGTPCALALIDQDHASEFMSIFAQPERQPVLKETFAGRNPANGDQKILSLYAAPEKQD